MAEISHSELVRLHERLERKVEDLDEFCHVGENHETILLKSMFDAFMQIYNERHKYLETRVTEHDSNIKWLNRFVWATLGIVAFTELIIRTVPFIIPLFRKI